MDNLPPPSTSRSDVRLYRHIDEQSRWRQRFADLLTRMLDRAGVSFAVRHVDRIEAYHFPQLGGFHAEWRMDVAGSLEGPVLTLVLIPEPREDTLTLSDANQFRAGLVATLRGVANVLEKSA